MTLPKSDPPSKPTPQTPRSGPEYERLVRQVADRVWQMWREELRRARERRRPG